MNSMKRNIGITSTTGTSAILLAGTTLHSFLGIGYGRESVEVLYSKIMKRPHIRKRWIDLDCLIIDEISMLDPDLFDKVEILARKIRQSLRPFGNIQLILSGDFLQLPCVGTDTFCFEADSWDRCVTNTIYLTEIIRQDDKMFQTCLNKVRIATIDEEVRNLLDSRKGVVLTNEHGIKPTKLFPTNYDVDRINNMELDKLALEGVEFYQYDMDIKVVSSVSNKQAVIERFKKNCTAKDELQLCVGAQVMLLKNLDLDNGLCNGSRGVVTKFIDEKPVVKFLNGQERVIMDEIWEVEENDKPILRAIQIPLKVAYAISIHKSQGDSLDYAEIDLSSIFECGQAYVALSRIKNIEGLSVIDIDYDKIKAHPKALEFYGH
jgi:ATP-dependent DNA helicase PIF1